jgi:ABC-type antimicrobial peptide transport system permease subunit
MSASVTIATESGHNRWLRVAGRSDRRGGIQPALVGVAIDLVRVSGLCRLMRATLYGIHTLDVTSFAIVAILLMGVAGLASWLPARRSARVNPMVALRSE